MRWFNNIAKYIEWIFCKEHIERKSLYQNKPAKTFVTIGPQLTELDSVRRNMCITPSFVMGFRDNYVICEYLNQINLINNAA